MEEQDKIEGEDTDVEGHRIKLEDEAAADKARHASDESDDPDVEGHRIVPDRVVPS